MTTRLIMSAAMVPVMLALAAQGQEPLPKAPIRYGFDYNPTLYKQKSPQDAIKSVLIAIDSKRVDYLLAQLADPQFVDAQVKEYKALFPKSDDKAATFLAFDQLVTATVEYFLSDPILIKEFRLFARDGQWELEDDKATGTVKSIPARKMFMKKIGDRWFIENRQQ